MLENTQPPAPIASEGWFPDPWGIATWRFWDGTQWTHHTKTGSSPAAKMLMNPDGRPVFRPAGAQLSEESRTQRRSLVRFVVVTGCVFLIVSVITLVIIIMVSSAQLATF